MKKFLLLILTSLTTIILILLGLSISLKSIVIKSLNTQVVAPEIYNKVSQHLKNYDISNEKLQIIEKNIKSSSATSNITTKYVDNIILSIVDNNDVILPNINDDVLKVLDENKKVLKDSNIYLTLESKKELVNVISRSELNNIYISIVEDVKKQLSEEDINHIKLYTNIISPNTKYVLIGITLLLLVLICIVKKSKYKWLKNISTSLLTAGITISFIIPTFVDYALNNAFQSIGNYEIDLNNLINIGYVYILLFIMLTLIYLIIKKIESGKEKIENDI